MSQSITGYTTADLAYYYADLARIPRLTNEQRHHLLTRIPAAPTQEAMMQIQEQLITSYLPLAKYLSFKLCPSSQYERSLPDLIGTANLVLVESIKSHDLTSIENLTSFLSTCLRGRIRGARAEESLIRLPCGTLARAREQGTSDHLDALLHLASLDQEMQWDQADGREEPQATPLIPTESAPPRDPVLRAQIETYLSLLSPRAQAILRLRYGLSEENERRHSTAEIAQLLGFERGIVHRTERDAIARLRALMAGKATIGKQNGKPCICYAESHKRPITDEEETILLHLYTERQAQGVSVSGRTLAQITGIPLAIVHQFLCVHRTETKQQAKERERQHRLEEAYRRLQAQGKAVSGDILAKEARSGKAAALAFLKAHRGSLQG